MNCPACKKVMIEEDFGGVKIDVCKDGCKGLWFDWGELVRLDESDEGFGDTLKEALNSTRDKDADRGRINCPKCNIPMVAHLSRSLKEVTVDECYGCGGFFLDAGELKVMRDNFMTEEEGEAFVNKLLLVPVHQKHKENPEKKEQRSKAVEKVGGMLKTDVIKKLLSG